MTDPGATAPTRFGRAVRKFALLLSRALYRSVQVRRRTSSPPGRADLIVANHFAGFTDPVVVIAATERLPRFLAAAAIWNVPVVRRIMDGVGAIKVLRSKDLEKHSASENVSMFRDAEDALAHGDLVAIFPEGVSRDVSHIEPVRTGAARILLGAHAQGVRGIRIVPVGIHYSDKAALRSRVFVNVDEAIELDVLLPSVVGDGPADASNHEAVRALTDEIERVLRDAAPDYDSFEQRRALRRAAEIAVRSELPSDDGVAFARREQVANALTRGGDTERATLTDAVRVYDDDLEALGLDDQTVAGGMTARSFLGTVAVNVLVGLVLLPFALVGVVINAIPALLVRAVDLRHGMARSTKATVKPLVALIAFGFAWGFFAWIGWRVAEFAGVAAVLLLMPLYGAAAIILTERLALIARAWTGWRRARRSRRALLDRVQEHRETIVRLVTDA